MRRATLQRLCPQGKQRRPRTPAASLAQRARQRTQETVALFSVRNKRLRQNGTRRRENSKSNTFTPGGAARTLPRRGKQRRPKPGAPNPAPQTRRPKPGAPNPAPQTRRPKPGAPNPAPQTRRPKPGGPKPSGPKSGAPNPVAQSSESQKHESSMTCTARPPSFSMGYLAAPASVGRRTREVVAGRRMDGISGTMEAIQSDEKSSILMLAGGGAYLAPQGQAASPPAPGPSPQARKPASPQARKPASPQAPKPPSPPAPNLAIPWSPNPRAKFPGYRFGPNPPPLGPQA